MDSEPTVTLHPHRWTPLPGTNVIVCSHAGRPVTVHRHCGCWDLSPLVVPGRVGAWAALADRPQLGPWPILPLARRTTYRSRSAGSPVEDDGGR